MPHGSRNAPDLVEAGGPSIGSGATAWRFEGEGAGAAEYDPRHVCRGAPLALLPHDLGPLGT